MICKYNLLFDLQVKHHYFESGDCEGLIFSGLGKTLALIKNYSFKIVSSTAGFTFYANSDFSNKDFLTYIESVSGATSFEFSATTLNTNFYRFTDLPVNELGLLVYDSDNGIVDDKESILLKEGFEQRTNVNKLFKLSVNFKDIIKSNKNSSLHYEIQFKPRSSQWKYNIINNSKQLIDGLSIKTSSNIRFNSGEKIILKNGQEATCFSSKGNMIPLSESPQYEFDLETTTTKLGNNRTKTIFKGLPYPNPSQIEINQMDGKELISSLIYVYI
jgi:hypothetical protein